MSEAVSRPVIVIVGRPNVGKSTLFNSLIKHRQAIVSPVSGTTRDRLYAPAKIGDFVVDVVDTAGIDQEIGDATFGPEMLEQVQEAVSEADLLVFVLDAQSGLTHDDKVLANIIRKAETPTVVFINKVDNQARDFDADLLNLGIGETVAGSLAQRRGGQELEIALVEALKKQHVSTPHQSVHENQELPRITLIGRPNVGKSSLFNALANDERVIVSDIPGTTRDTIDSKVEVEDGISFIITDTAGLRRRGKIGENNNKIERYSVMRTLRAISQADVVILVVDVEEGLTRGDVHAAMHALENKKRLITVFNKTDLIADPTKINTRRFPFLTKSPMIFVSAREKVAIDQLHEQIQLSLSTPDELQNQSSSVEIPPTTPGQ
jgi:GTP-binding protein